MVAFAPVAPSPCATIGVGACKSDSECRDGKDGQCVLSLPSGTCSCTYDACFVDSDCSGGVCACSGHYSGNTCVSGNCRLDADCGRGGYCSPVMAACGGAIIGYQCHTQKDKCVTDAECVDRACTFVPNEGGWACRSAPGCPL